VGIRSALLEGFGDDFAWSLFDAAPDGIVVVSDSGEIAFANDQAGLLFGCTTADLVGRSVDDLVPEAVRVPHRAHRTRYRAHPQVRSMGAGLQLRAQRRDGSAFDAEISLSPLDLDGHAFVVAAVRDVGARVAADAELRAREAELQEARRAVLLAEDHDRLARDLHDTVIQRLFAAGLSLQAASAMSADERIQERLATTIGDLDDTIRELRNAIFALQAPDPGPSGVRGRILDVITATVGSLGFEPRIEFAGALETVDERIVAHLLPTIRESLTNVAKHARASQVRVSVAVGSEVTVEVTDDGVGAPTEVYGGHGVANVTRRAEELGGHAELAPAPSGSGSRLVWSVPATQA
jgi:PAS domain S-box-containing protein